MKKTNINVRSSHLTKEYLKELAELTGQSQADVIEKLIIDAHVIVKQTGEKDIFSAYIEYFKRHL